MLERKMGAKADCSSVCLGIGRVRGAVEINCSARFSSPCLDEIFSFAAILVTPACS